jgi:hypothetical protein
MVASPTTALSAGTGIGLVGRNAFGFVRTVPWTASYQDDPYLDLLNRALRAELDCLHAYEAVAGEKYCILAGVVENHDKSVSELSELIVKRQGIPENHSGLSGELGKAIIQLTALMPEWIHSQAQRSMFLRSEKKLAGLYDDLVDLAPIRDLTSLAILGDRVAKNITFLGNILPNASSNTSSTDS